MTRQFRNHQAREARFLPPDRWRQHLMYLRFSVLLVSALSVVSCGGSNNNPAPAPSPSPMSISIVAGARLLTTTAYVPNPLSVARGTTVTWVNNDTSTHDNI